VVFEAITTSVRPPFAMVAAKIAAMSPPDTNVFPTTLVATVPAMVTVTSTLARVRQREDDDVADHERRRRR
jgi:hypothetical protein